MFDNSSVDNLRSIYIVFVRFISDLKIQPPAWVCTVFINPPVSEQSHLLTTAIKVARLNGGYKSISMK